MPWPRHALPALRLLAALLLTVACSPAETDTAATPDTADSGTATPTCPQPSQRPNGGCCPAGHSFDAALSGCVPVGPADCAAVSLVNPGACIPRWCWDLLAPDDTPCAEPGLLCRPAGRLCTADERAASAGCPAGQVPDDVGACTPAGLHANSPLRPAGGPVAPLPPLPALPAATPPRWCTKDGLARPCAASETGCATGEVPDKTGTCIPAGVPWLCPPGFVVDAKDPGSAARPPACTPDPALCGAGPWPADLPATGVFYVDAAAKAGGDGSTSSPFNTLFAAVKAAPTGATLALSAGTWTEPLVLGKGLVVRGRCAAMTQLANNSAPANVQLDGDDGPVTLRDVSVVGSGIGVIAIEPVAATIERVHIHGASVAGIAALKTGAELTIRDAVVAATVAKMDGTAGRGIEASGGGRVMLERVRISQQRDVGLMVSHAGSRALGDGVLIADTRPTQLSKVRGRGVDVSVGAQAELNAVRIIGSAEIGVRLAGAGTRLKVTGLRVQGSLQPPAGPKGHGVVARDGAELVAVGARIEDATGHGMHVTEPGTAARLAGLQVLRTRPAVVTGHGQGVVATDGAWLELVGGWLSDNRQSGLAVGDAGTQVWARALLVDATDAPTAKTPEAAAVLANGGASLTLSHVRLHHNRGVGLVVTDVDTLVQATDLLADGGLSLGPGKLASGMGVVVQLGGRLELNRGRLSGNQNAGVVLRKAGTTAWLRELLVDGSKPDPSTGASGAGVLVLSGSRLELQHGRLSGNHERALSVEATGTLAAVEDLLVDGTVSSLTDGFGGDAIVAVAGGRVQAGRALLIGNRSSAILVGHAPSRLDLWGARIESTTGNAATGAYGAGITVVMGSRADLDGVIFRDNRSVGAVAGGDDTVMRLTGCVIEDTAASTAQEQNGAGAASLLGSRMDVRASIVRNNRVAGLFFTGLGGQIWDTVVSKTGVASVMSSSGDPIQFGDGVLASQVSEMTIGRCLLVDNQRAGLYVAHSDQVDISSLVISGNVFGLATTEGQIVQVGPGAIYGNSQANVAGEISLGVPHPPDPGAP